MQPGERCGVDILHIIITCGYRNPPYSETEDGVGGGVAHVGRCDESGGCGADAASVHGHDDGLVAPLESTRDSRRYYAALPRTSAPGNPKCVCSVCLCQGAVARGHTATYRRLPRLPSLSHAACAPRVQQRLTTASPETSSRVEHSFPLSLSTHIVAEARAGRRQHDGAAGAARREFVDCGAELTPCRPAEADVEDARRRLRHLRLSQASVRDLMRAMGKKDRNGCSTRELTGFRSLTSMSAARRALVERARRGSRRDDNMPARPIEKHTARIRYLFLSLSLSFSLFPFLSLSL